MRWYRLAAEHGDISSYADIGIFYAHGYGVKKDKNRAVQYYIMGAEKGDTYAQYLLGWAYYKGFGIQSDGDRSIYWLTKAAENGSARAMDKLAVIYGNGLVYEERDREAGRKWAEKAWQTRKRTGESDPEVDRRLRFFGIDPDDLWRFPRHAFFTVSTIRITSFVFFANGSSFRLKHIPTGIVPSIRSAFSPPGVFPPDKHPPESARIRRAS